MTAPVPPASEVAFEQWVVQQVIGPLRGVVEGALRQIVALYLRLAGSLGQPLPDNQRGYFASEAARIIAAVQFQGRQPLQAFVMSALALGAARAAAAGLAPPAGVPVQPLLPDWVGTVVTTIEDRVLAVLAAAVAAWQIGAPPKDFSQVAATFARTQQAVTMVERDARWTVNAAINAGQREVMDLTDTPRMWLGEDDACLHCLAYMGEVAQPRQPYPGGLTFYVDPRGNMKPLTFNPVWGPPLHPNCRCREEPYLGSEGYPVMPWENREVSVSEALKREARRRVLRGKSGSDSLPARLRAADALLAIGAHLPKSVEAKARAAVKAGAFK